MGTENLKRHIYDTVKEWQMKIGSLDESIGLYYPAESLKSLLGLEQSARAGNWMERLRNFAGKFIRNWEKLLFHVRVNVIALRYLKRDVLTLQKKFRSLNF